MLTIRDGKFGKSRELPLHPSTVAALRPICAATTVLISADTPALLSCPAGTRLRYTDVQPTFQQAVRHCGITPRSAACRPRIHDLRHSFAVNTILDGYKAGDPGIPPGDPVDLSRPRRSRRNTYWYLSAAPELLALAGDRLERHLGGDA